MFVVDRWQRSEFPRRAANLRRMTSLLDHSVGAMEGGPAAQDGAACSGISLFHHPCENRVEASGCQRALTLLVASAMRQRCLASASRLAIICSSSVWLSAPTCARSGFPRSSSPQCSISVQNRPHATFSPLVQLRPYSTGRCLPPRKCGRRLYRSSHHPIGKPQIGATLRE